MEVFRMKLGISLLAGRPPRRTELIYHDSEGEGEMADDKFLREMQDSLQRQQERADLATKSKLHDKDVIKEEGPNQWRVLKQWVQDAVKNINRGLRFSSVEQNLNTFTLGREDDAARAEVTFSPSTGTISYEGGRQGFNRQGLFLPKVNGTTLQYVRGPGYSSTSLTIEEIGQILVRFVVNPE